MDRERAERGEHERSRQEKGGGVSNLEFNAQSTITVISGQRWRGERRFVVVVESINYLLIVVFEWVSRD